MRNEPVKLAFAGLSVLISASFFFIVLGTALPAFEKFLLAVLAVATCGVALSLAFDLEGWCGIYMLRSKAGLRFLDEEAKRHPLFWQVFAEIGMVVGYGSLAHFLINRKNWGWKRFALVYGAGTVLLVLFSAVIAPLAISSLLAMLSGGAEFASAGARLQDSVSQFGFAKYVFLLALAVGGIALTTTASIVIYAGSVALAIIGALLGNSAALANTSPGGVPLLPGINLPFAAGIAALAVVLVVHEGMHGILARRHGLPLTSAGLVFFGFIPFGAFVDIDEKKLMKEKADRQNAVFVAGTAANFAACLAFLLLLFATIAVTAPLRLSGVYVVQGAGSIANGSLIEAIDGKPVSTMLGVDLKPDTAYEIKTNEGTFSRETDNNGKLGITYVLADSEGATGEVEYASGFGWVASFISFLVLAFALNFVVAAMNLVPLPLFDGYHLMKNGVRNQLAARVISYIVAAAFLLTLFPWVLR